MSIFTRLHKETQIFSPDAIGNGIDTASGTANKYITDFSDNGIWVCPEGAGPDSTTHQAKATTTGWHIADAIELIKLGVSYIKLWVDNSIAKIRIGPEDDTHFVVASDELSGIDSEGSKVFNVGLESVEYDSLRPQGDSVSVSWDASQSTTTTKTITVPSTAEDPYFEVDYYVVINGVDYYDYARFEIEAGYPVIPSVLYHGSYQTGITVSYDGNQTVTIVSAPSSASQQADSAEAMMFLTGLEEFESAPSFTFGSRLGASGAFSTVAGEGLVASQSHQFVSGRYNKISDAAFAVGNGYINSFNRIERSNAFEVDLDGNAKAYGNVSGATIGGFKLGTPGSDSRYSEDDSANNLSIGNSATTIASITLTPGTWLITAWARFDSDATGRRVVSISTSTDAINTGDFTVTQPPTSGAFSGLSTVGLVQPSANTTYNLNVRQTSGTTLGCSGHIRAVRIL